jgi:hypothetical protein
MHGIARMQVRQDGGDGLSMGPSPLFHFIGYACQPEFGIPEYNPMLKLFPTVLMKCRSIQIVARTDAIHLERVVLHENDDTGGCKNVVSRWFNRQDIDFL